jgi:hypothetical protein
MNRGRGGGNAACCVQSDGRLGGTLPGDVRLQGRARPYGTIPRVEGGGRAGMPTSVLAPATVLLAQHTGQHSGGPSS